jgi:hypothetical protein
MTAIRAGITAYRQEALIPKPDLDWDTYEARLYRYHLYDLYYANAAYKSLSAIGAITANRKIDQALYKRVRGVYNPVFRLVETYTSKVYGGEIDLERFASGAIAFRGADERVVQAARDVILRSLWRTGKDLYIRTGAKLGDVFLKVVDEPQYKRVRLEILHPSIVRDIVKDGSGRIVRAVIEYDSEDGTDYTPGQHSSSKPSYVYGEVITPDSFATYRDGKPWGYAENGAGELPVEWRNEYGFVPLVHVAHRNEGLMWGASAFNASLDKIDELNDVASLLNDAVRKSVDVPYLMIGIGKPDNKKTFTSDERDDMKAMYIPGASPSSVAAQPLMPSLDIAATISHIQYIISELERDMPELAMHQLRGQAAATAPGIRAAFNDAVDRFQAAQGIYDAGFMMALQMAIAIGGFRKYAPFRGFDLRDYTDSLFDFWMTPRPIIDDELSKNEKINALVASGAPSEWIWRELGVSEQDIAFAAEDAERRKQEMVDLLQGNPDGNNNAGDLQRGAESE